MFSKSFQSLKGSHSFFWNFATEWMLKNLKGPPFTVFGIVRFFEMNNFCLKIRFSQAQHAISEFCFLKTGFFSMLLFSNLFSSKPPPQFLLKMKRFGSIKDCSRFSTLCDLPETFFKNFFRKISNFFPDFCFFLKKCFRLRKMGFLLFPVGEEWFSRFLRIPSGIFWRCKIDEILTMSFYTWFSV